jgi:hypothetical protein
MSGTYIALRACFTNFMGGHLYRAGDPLLPGDEPGKHFALNGIADSQEKAALPTTPGDDIRSTMEIRAELEAKHGIKLAKSANRKTLFNAWVDAEKGADKPVVKTRRTVPPEEMDDAPPTVTDPLAGVNLLEMSPDDIQKIRSKEWRECLAARYNVSMPVRSSVGELAERAMQEELNAGDPKGFDPSK